MKKQKTIAFRPRDMIPVYGFVKDIYDHKKEYLSPIEKLPVDVVNDFSLKASMFYFYNFGIIIELGRGLGKIINGCQ